MNKLDFSISLREKGLDSKDIKKEMKESGFDDSEIQYYLKKSDEIFLDQSYRYNRYKSKGKNKNTLKMLILIISLILLTGVLLGYATIGLIGLFILWSLIGYGSFRN
ncbi:hypothetical protein [Winogradskyella pacifica]|uniref:DUF1700 domain-containing protein n=1 Tax=Winogradskyella pacifica TaxID=664642 RepID=A0A3D9N2R0_9FLAO|nr:hypothetical protein [Winogradskyella pacifica]REE27177.1 hypothetical protein DFQ09_1014 [Winogradskyella pacifica]